MFQLIPYNSQPFIGVSLAEQIFGKSLSSTATTILLKMCLLIFAWIWTVQLLRSCVAYDIIWENYRSMDYSIFCNAGVGCVSMNLQVKERLTVTASWGWWHCIMREPRTRMLNSEMLSRCLTKMPRVTLSGTLWSKNTAIIQNIINIITVYMNWMSLSCHWTFYLQYYYFSKCTFQICINECWRTTQWDRSGADDEGGRQRWRWNHRLWRYVAPVNYFWVIKKYFLNFLLQIKTFGGYFIICRIGLFSVVGCILFTKCCY